MTLGKLFFIIVFLLLFLIRLYFKFKYDHIISFKHLKLEPLNLIIFRYILGIILMINIIHFLFFNNFLNFLIIKLNNKINIIGLIISLLSLIFLFITHEYLGNNFSTTILVKEHSRLVKNGPYKYIRHPMYTSYLLLFVGSFFITGHIIISLSGILIILSLMTKRLKIEEKHLIEKFGYQYIEYINNTGKFLPIIQKGNNNRPKN